MVEKLLQLLSIRCAHKRTSQPFAAQAAYAVNSGVMWDMPTKKASHYVVCLECGQKFSYDWSKMRIVR